MVLVPSLGRRGETAVLVPEIGHQREQRFKPLAEIAFLRPSENRQDLHTVQRERGRQIRSRQSSHHNDVD